MVFWVVILLLAVLVALGQWFFTTIPGFITLVVLVVIVLWVRSALAKARRADGVPRTEAEQLYKAKQAEYEAATQGFRADITVVECPVVGAVKHSSEVPSSTLAVEIDSASERIALTRWHAVDVRGADWCYTYRSARVLPTSAILGIGQDTEIIHHTSSTTRTSTGSMAGRALVGGALAGKGGAAVGAATARTSTSSTTTASDGATTVWLELDDAEHPVIEVRLSDRSAARALVSRLKSVVRAAERPQSEASPALEA